MTNLHYWSSAYLYLQLVLMVLVIVTLTCSSTNKCYYVVGVPTDQLGDAPIECNCDKEDGGDGEKQPCQVDGYVGSNVIYEDDMVRVWNFTLAPGQMTSMHRHDHDYHFVAIKPTQLEVYGEDGSRLFDFRAEGVLGFKINGDYLEPTGIELPWPVPRTHSAKNIGSDDYYEILYESKISTTVPTATTDDQPDL
jgi:hypothetical protein